MKLKSLATAILSASLLASPIQPVFADSLGAGILGGIIGGVIVNEGLKNQRRNAAYSAARAERRDIQTSLNYFEFAAGTPDGVFGSKTRSAVSAYQYYLGFPTTGNLTEFEKNFLLTSYNRAIAGGHTTLQLASQNEDGMRGLLLVYRDEATGTASTKSASNSQTTPAPATLLPTFGAVEQASLASHCNKVSLLTNSNGGFVSVASMSNPSLALNEQFCLARTYAIAGSEDLAASVQGYSSAQIQANCEGIVAPMQDLIAAISLQSREEVLPSVAGFVLQTGMSPVQLTTTAKICLGVGYRTDNSDVAIASALLLVALGKPVYGELIGHHLAQGIGATQRTDLANDWFATAIQALDNGAEAAFAPSQPERVDLLRLATVDLASTPEVKTQSATFTPMPVFKISQ